MISQIGLTAAHAVGASVAAAQIDAVGGATSTAVVAVLASLLAVVLSVLVTYRYATGYLRTRQRPLLYLTVGMVLLAPAPMFLRLLLGNTAVVGASERTFVVNVSKLCGLVIILSVVHRQ